MISAPFGREPVGIAQHGSSLGFDFPLLAPSLDIEKLLADFYLAYEDNTNTFAFPFHIEHLFGFGTDFAPPAITPVHSHEVRVRDANNVVVFDSLLVDPSKFRTAEWAGRLRILEWVDDDGQVLRVVYHTAWGPNDTDTRTYATYIEPTAAVLDARTLFQLPKRVTSIRVGLTTLSPDDDGDGADLDFVNGFNTTFEVDDEETETIDGGRRATELTLNVAAGTGNGRFGPGCDDTFPPIMRRINNISPSTRGNFLLDASGCYRVEQPVQSVLAAEVPNVSPRELQIRDHALLLSNDCGPCCECQDFINVWEAIRNQRDVYAALIARAQSARDLYHSNRERWLNDASCRESGRTRAVLQPTAGGEVGVSTGFCNTSAGTDNCLEGVVLHISFEYTDGTGVCFDSVDPGAPLTADTTATFIRIVPNSTFRSGNVDPQNPNTGGSPSVQEFFTISGAYPHYWIYFDALNPANLGSVVFRTQFEAGAGVGEDIIEVVTEAFLVGPNPVIQPNGTFVPGYTLGAGPLTTPDSMRLQECPTKRAATLVPLEE